MDVEGCPLPEDRWYDVENDVWLQVESDGVTATLGATAPLVAFAGRFLSVGFRPVLGLVGRGRSVATVESLRYTGAIRVPVDATVRERNSDLVERPKWLNDEPYDRGWVVRLTLSTPVGPEAGLATAAEVRTRYEARIAELRIRCYPAVPDLEVYEIGSECSAVLARLDEELARRSPGDVILLVTDDRTSPIEMVRWSDRTGHPVLHHRLEGNLHHFLVRREAHPVPRRR
ncbi:MAG: hypothetical protein L3J86_04830 [Thermoplasmata archaeon]|nr:hypothetical protein [Thermoplasmata archaeon]